MFAKAGITTLPKTQAALIADGKKLQRANKSVANYSALYFPGQYWYAALPILWDAGGAIATNKSGKWAGAFSAAKSLQGLQQFKSIQNQLSARSSRTVNTNAPDQDAVFASGKAGMIIGGGWEPGVVYADNAKMRGNVGAFVFPGTNQYKPAPVFLGGSDIAVANNSPNKALALAWIKLMASRTYQTQMYNNDGLMPNATQLLGLANNNPIQRVFLAAAKQSRGTPASPGWAVIEGDTTMEHLFSNVAQASGPAAIKSLAQGADAHLNAVLNH
jgi:N,N'-diacetylchitobiose transport system substrate-binding protein